jgi:hypothetical protein
MAFPQSIDDGRKSGPTYIHTLHSIDPTSYSDDYRMWNKSEQYNLYIYKHISACFKDLPRSTGLLKCTGSIISKRFTKIVNCPT